MKRNANCTYCGKELVANPNVCKVRNQLRATDQCGFQQCPSCDADLFICSACQELFTIDELELRYLQDEERALLGRIDAIRVIELRLARSLEK